MENKNKSQVGIIMGSDSDLAVMSKAAIELEKLGIPYSVTIYSAHRTPKEVSQYATSARDRGLEVIIAGAGMSAALAGAIASETTLPVIGVPIKGGMLDGLDALLSSVQMPPGIPVAVVGLNGAKNAALLAARIVAVNDSSVADRLDKYKKDMGEIVKEKARKIEEVGYEEYFKGM